MIFCCYAGDGINGIIGAIGRASKAIEYIQVRREEMAAFMACAHSKFTDEPGVCLATSWPGAIHLFNGLYDAEMDHQSVVAIVGQQARMENKAQPVPPIYQPEVGAQAIVYASLQNRREIYVGLSTVIATIGNKPLAGLSILFIGAFLGKIRWPQHEYRSYKK